MLCNFKRCLGQVERDMKARTTHVSQSYTPPSYVFTEITRRRQKCTDSWKQAPERVKRLWPSTRAFESPEGGSGERAGPLCAENWLWDWLAGSEARRGSGPCLSLEDENNKMPMEMQSASGTVARILSSRSRLIDDSECHLGCQIQATRIYRGHASSQL